MLSFLKKKQLRKWYANQLDFELGPLMRKKVQIAQISLNILAPIPRKDTNPSVSIRKSHITVIPHITHSENNVRLQCIHIITTFLYFSSFTIIRNNYLKQFFGYGLSRQ